MSVPLVKGLPAYLTGATSDNSNYKRSLRYYVKLYQAWPSWCADHPGFGQIYKRAKRMRAAGLDVEVDHIVPICSKYVSGLHVPWNLRIVPAEVNRRKSNQDWPGHPCEVVDWVGEYVPQQLSLPF